MATLTRQRTTLNSSEVARLFNVTRATLYRWVKQEKVPEPLSDPETGRWIWRQSDLATIGEYIRNKGREK
jgi:predicted site-specific integrase-resolvase